MQQTFFVSEAQIQAAQQLFGLDLIGAGEVLQFAHGGDEPSDVVWDRVFAYYMDNGMPYEVAKARAGDPYEWVQNELSKWFK